MFEKRLKKPAPNNKYYIQNPKGYNPCILGNEKHRDKNLNVLPNCVGYATGRFNEIIGNNWCSYLGSTDAKNFISMAQSQGLKMGLTPKLGACIVWGNSEHGHVAIVEDIYSDTDILVSQSGWSSSLPMWTGRHQKGSDGNWTDGYDQRWMKGKYDFLGFIYQPKEVIEMTQEEFNKMADNYILSRSNLLADNYAKDALNWAKTVGIMNGNEKGNQMPKSFVTRQDFALMLKRYNDGK